MSIFNYKLNKSVNLIISLFKICVFLPSENGQFAIKMQLNSCNNTNTGITIYLKQQCTDSL